MSSSEKWGQNFNFVFEPLKGTSLYTTTPFEVGPIGIKFGAGGFVVQTRESKTLIKPGHSESIFAHWKGEGQNM